jgi:GH18 family chitinase
VVATEQVWPRGIPLPVQTILEKTMTAKMVNAWMLVIEDDPAGTNYNSPDSCYQRLIKDNIYRAVDLLYLGVAETVPTSAKTVPAGDGSSYTIQISSADDHRNGLTNQDYMNYIMRDAKKSNPKIKIAIMLDYGNPNALSQIFPDPANPAAASADKFAANLMSYLKHYGLDGFDLDWESPICDDTTQAQFRLLIDAIGAQFKRQTDKHYYLTLSPASPGNLDVGAVNRNVDFLNLQLYSGFTSPGDYNGVNPGLFAYGAKFEADQPSTEWGEGHQTARQAYDDNQANYKYSIFTQYRLNSQNFGFEQKNQKELYALVFPK